MAQQILSDVVAQVSPETFYIVAEDGTYLGFNDVSVSSGNPRQKLELFPINAFPRSDNSEVRLEFSISKITIDKNMYYTICSYDKLDNRINVMGVNTVSREIGFNEMFTNNFNTLFTDSRNFKQFASISNDGDYYNIFLNAPYEPIQLKINNIEKFKFFTTDRKEFNILTRELVVPDNITNNFYLTIPSTNSLLTEYVYIEDNEFKTLKCNTLINKFVEYEVNKTISRQGITKLYIQKSSNEQYAIYFRSEYCPWLKNYIKLTSNNKINVNQLDETDIVPNEYLWDVKKNSDSFKFLNYGFTLTIQDTDLFRCHDSKRQEIDITSFGSIENPLACIHTSHAILTPNGYKNIYELSDGDIVSTNLGTSKIIKKFLFHSSKQPFCIPKHFFTTNYPSKNTLLTSEHLIVYNNLYYHPEFSGLFRQKKMLKQNEYFHLLLEDYNHNIILDSNLVIESLTGNEQDLITRVRRIKNNNKNFRKYSTILSKMKLLKIDS